MNLTRKISLKSRVSPKNPYNATGLSGNIITSPIEALLSTITVNFGKISQNDANFAARVRLLTAQKTQKAAASRNSCGFTLCN
ncbi:MAG: hypothetical protein IM473_16585 [Microcystis sp. M015S2]|uniref:hypothetical protein n=1 Tax=unclassified Microcystis TaxID=2643300 RepID=UPI00258F40EB|nr:MULTISPECIES: hypothetical protein [unclassified Microcystis]MCA2711450.1 hypothetical protein [Microcystis sp. M025S2]MCA2743961.1 hypothetical protein [Microcystis sp. M015S2]MCA2761181.1 hypothetical protein [Microcystis sp. M145S2]